MLKEVYFDYIGTYAREILPIIPIECFPPYGDTRRGFSRFLENVPVNGLGFHATSTNHQRSIQEHGFDPRYIPTGGFKLTYCLLLDPSSDFVLAQEPNLSGSIATYHRLRNGINKIMYQFGIRAVEKFRFQDTSGDDKPVLLVFDNSDGKINFKQTKEYRQKLAEIQLRKRLFYLPRGYVSLAEPGKINDIPEGYMESLAPEKILHAFVLGNSENLAEFTDRVIVELMNATLLPVSRSF